MMIEAIESCNALGCVSKGADAVAHFEDLGVLYCSYCWEAFTCCPCCCAPQD